MVGPAIGHIQGVSSELRLMKPEGDAGLGQDWAGIPGRGRGPFGELDDKKVEEGWGLVPYQMIDGLVAIGGVFEVAGVYGGDNGFVAYDLDTKSGMRKEDDDGVGGMEVSGGGVVHRDLPFQQSEVMVFLYDLMVWLPADGKLGFQAGGKKDGD
jgi:hypothetical protein